MKKCLSSLIAACCFTSVLFAQQADTITTASGLKYFLTQHGTGPLFKPGWVAIQHYVLTLADGTKIDDTRERNQVFAAQYPTKRSINGYNEATLLMHVGDRGKFIMTPELGYGKLGWQKVIPPDATLIFDIELLDMKEKSLEMILDSVMFGKPVRTDSVPHTAAAIATFKQLKKEKFNNLYVSEDALNDIGYQIIKKYPTDAVELMKLNVEMYPKSANAYDSLGEAYMTAGYNKLAIKNYEKSLKLNPKNTNATDMINKMKGVADK